MNLSDYFMKITACKIWYYAETCYEWRVSTTWCLGNTAPKKRRNGGKLLVTLCVI